MAAVAAMTLLVAACSPSNEETPDSSATTGGNGGGDVTALSGQLNGAGASSQEAAVAAWVAGFQASHPDVSVNYDPIGSGGGRTQFGDGAVSWAGSDALMDEEEYALAAEACDGDSGAVHLPMYISPIAVVFNVDGVDSLNMDANLIAQIFDGKITKWNDAAIAEQNEGVELPDMAITPVYRADESGTTENFVDYLAKASDSWPYEVSGDWPVNVGESGPATSGQMQIVNDTAGSFAYVDASRAGSLGTVALKVGENYVPFSPEAAAAAVTASPLSEGANGENDLAFELDRTTTADGVYPMVLISYEILCQQYDDENERALVTEFLKYVASAEGQQASADAAGSSPIGDELSGRVTVILDGIAAA
jgi:phosphate transport system substrate-binding protein